LSFSFFFSHLFLPSLSNLSQGGLSSIREGCHLCAGIPVIAMLARATKSGDEALKKMKTSTMKMIRIGAGGGDKAHSPSLSSKIKRKKI
jgi:hypothetical protein